jgi:hypothetical protein
MSPPPKLSRRTLTIGGIAGAAAVVVAGAVYEAPKLFKRRLHGEYADLVGKLNDPEKAALLGKRIQANAFPSDVGPSLEELAAKDLKKRMARNTLAELMAKDASDMAHVIEADGWVIPLVLGELCILAAQSV